ncbi:MAG: SpoIID/LytB domain-containing protein [Magnetococcales bacterium]|nr:SpoIID/LytB domain-containing protein [Magnetococcales bacterium]
MLSTHLKSRRFSGRFLPVLCFLLIPFAINIAFAQEAGFESNPEVIAQWNLNVGSLAMDERRYLDALSYFENALESSPNAGTRVKALLYMATTFSSFLDSNDSALRIYQQIEREYPSYAQSALYREALLLFDAQRPVEALQKVRLYNSSYGQGRFHFQMETIGSESEKVIASDHYKRQEAKRRKAMEQAEEVRKENARRQAEVRAQQQEAARRQQVAYQRQQEAAKRRQEAERQRLEAERMKEQQRWLEAERLRKRAEQEAKLAQQAAKLAEYERDRALRAKQEANAREAARRLAASKAQQKVHNIASSDFNQVPEPIVRVLLSKYSRVVIVKGEKLTLRQDGVRRSLAPGATFVAKSGRLHLNGSPIGKRAEVLAASPISIGYGKSGKTKKKVRGSLLLKAKKNRVRMINNVAMESYLLSVVPAESHASWKMPALRAQALAARTYAYNDTMRHASKDFDVYDTIRSQVYAGVPRERKRTSKAVRETRGQIITTVRNGRLKPILAMFAANSGGITADPEKEYSTRWDTAAHPYLISHPDPWSLKAGKKSLATWRYKHTRHEIEKNLKRRKVRIGRLEQITPTYVGPSGRVVRVRLAHDGGKFKEIRFRPKVTLGLGGRIGTLPDTIVTIKKSGDHFIFDGKGFGHGIGYMQWGGQEMAKAGHDYRQIIQFYYPGTNIMSFWN